MDTKVILLVDSVKDELVRFTQEIIRTKSYSCHEQEVVECIRSEMIRLEYDHTIIDKKSGSVIGVIGNGPTKIIFDSHIDTVEVNNPKEWSVDPFGGEIRNGNIYGRGASDMKSSAAASVYAGYVIKQLGAHKGMTIYVCCSTLEENYDGEGLYSAIVNNDLHPDYAVICEPTHLQISLGQRGRSIYKITTHGLSAHGSAPEKGINAVYKMQKILQRIEQLSERFMSKVGEKGSIAVSKIESSAVSLCAIPESCSIYIDRRMTLSEDEAFIAKEMDELIYGIDDTTWEIYIDQGISWTGENIEFRSFLPAWEIEKDHPLVTSFVNTYRELYQTEPIMYKWDFSTNGVATAKLGIPTIGFGAGIEKLAHMTDESCPISDIISACKFYALLPKYLK